jgi:uncharacterized protein with von Willebrand factor type A (vWA) domain
VIADLAALARALHVLRPDPGGDAGRIAAAFGWDLAQITASPPPPEPAASPSPPLRREAPPPPVPAAAPERPRVVASGLEALDRGVSSPPEWLGRSSLPQSGADPAAAGGDTATNGAQLAPLLPPRAARAIMLRLVGENLAKGPPDLDALIRRIAAGDMVARIPRRTLRRLAPRILVLFDEGPGMDPFAADQMHFLAALERVVGRDRTIVRCFSGSLGDGLRDPASGAFGDLAELPAGLVLILSDFGCGRSSLRHSGHDAAALAAAGRVVIGLNPYPPERWPKAPPAGLTMLYWHEGLRLADLRRARRCESPAP